MAASAVRADGVDGFALELLQQLQLLPPLFRPSLHQLKTKNAKYIIQNLPSMYFNQMLQILGDVKTSLEYVSLLMALNGHLNIYHNEFD